jgi:hypothetical protein
MKTQYYKSFYLINHAPRLWFVDDAGKMHCTQWYGFPYGLDSTEWYD